MTKRPMAACTRAAKPQHSLLLSLILGCIAVLSLGSLTGCANRFQASTPSAVEQAAAPQIDAAALGADIEWLADDAREGRGVGSTGLDQAAAYIASAFREAGLEPGGDAGSFLAPFQMPSSVEISDASLELSGETLARGADFDVFITSASGTATGKVVFAGYGISAPEHGYDDYEDIDVDGAIVVVLTDRPEIELGDTAGQASLLRRSYKFANANKHGAAAVVLVPSITDAPDLPGNAGNESRNPTTQAGGVIAVGLNRAVADRVFGPKLGELQAQIDTTAQPASAHLESSSASVFVNVVREQATAANVIGIRVGSDPALRKQAVVVGAHYDGLGLGIFSSLAPQRRGEVHNGADDNASGAAGLIALARAFAQFPPARRTLVLVAFAGEEAGLVGSGEFVRDPPIPLEDTVTMINLDMIGRLRDGKLIVFGIETSKGFAELVDRAAQGVPVSAELAEGGYSASDQTSFYARDIPVLFFFTGSHTEYHSPDDDADLINAPGTADVVRVVYRVARELLNADDRPQVEAAAAPSRGQGGGGGYGPYLGTIPDFGGMSEPGVLLQGVRSNSPAERAGLRGGDRIVGFDGADIANLEEYAALLFSARPGQRVEVIAVRDGARISIEVTLGQRR